MKELLQIRGKSLYVHVTGSPTAPALLYVHGGPGAGSYDFEILQEKLLAPHVCLITFDQRGVLRSDPLDTDEPCSLQDLLEDCEALRRELGLKRWSLLGHSFGGYLAALYTQTYPEVVQCLLFENPTLDLGLSARSLLRGAALEFSASGDEADAARCLEAAQRDGSPREAWDAFLDLGNALGSRRNSLYVHGPEKNFFEHLIEHAPFPTEYWSRGGMHQKKLFLDDQVFYPVLPDMHTVKQPVMLIQGQYDFVSSAQQVKQFQQALPNAQILRCTESAHFVHFEEPQLFSQAVSQFVLRHAAC